MWKKELDTLEGKTVPMEIKKNTYTTILHYILQFHIVNNFWQTFGTKPAIITVLRRKNYLSQIYSGGFLLRPRRG